MHTDAYCIHLRVRQRKTQHTNHRYNRIRNLFVFFVCVHLSVCAPFDLLLSISTLYILYTYYFLPVCLSSIYCLPLTINPPPFAAASQALNWNLNKFIWNKYFFFVCFFIYNIYIYIVPITLASSGMETAHGAIAKIVMPSDHQLMCKMSASRRTFALDAMPCTRCTANAHRHIAERDAA